MAYTSVPFGEISWEPGAHPLERKKIGAHGVTLLEFAPGFSDPNWCPNGHYFYVQEGILRIELGDAVHDVGAGQCCVLDAGTAHRAHNVGPKPLRLLVIPRT